MAEDCDRIVVLEGDPRRRLVEAKATCPFIGSAVAQGRLAVRNEVDNPLASIEDVRQLGNAGGGDLGDVLALFAAGNHAFMRGASGNLDAPVPDGLFSLELPGSQGSHPGHSGILEGNPKVPGSGRFSDTNYQRLVARAKDGWIKRSEVGRFIAENLLRDPDAKVFGSRAVSLLAGDLLEFVEEVAPVWMRRLLGSQEAGSAHRELEEKFTRLLGEDNLVGSAGEFGLLFALLANKPGNAEIDGEPAVAVQDLKAMFVDRRLPEGFESWKKSRADWVRHTTALMISAGRAYWAGRL